MSTYYRGVPVTTAHGKPGGGGGGGGGGIRADPSEVCRREVANRLQLLDCGWVYSENATRETRGTEGTVYTITQHI